MKTKRKIMQKIACTLVNGLFLETHKNKTKWGNRVIEKILCFNEVMLRGVGDPKREKI